MLRLGLSGTDRGWRTWRRLAIIPAAVFTRKLVASIERRIMLEKTLGQVKTDPDWDLPDPDEE